MQVVTETNEYILFCKWCECFVSIIQYESLEQKKTISKRPSRRHRRRPKNLLTEYARRQRKHVWLETHIWHAKRFKMVDHWGYKIPAHPCEKSLRASYRAIARHCLLQVGILNVHCRFYLPNRLFYYLSTTAEFLGCMVINTPCPTLTTLNFDIH